MSLYPKYRCGIYILPSLFFLTLFWQTRFSIGQVSAYVDYVIPFVYISDLFLLLWFLTVVRNKAEVSKLVLVIKRNKTGLIYLTFFLLAGFVSNFSSGVHVIGAFYRWFKVLEMVVVAILTGAYFSSEGKLSTMLKTLVWGLIPLSALAVAEFILQRSLGCQLLGEWRFTAETPGIATFFWRGRYWLRPLSTFPHPNVLGAILSLVFAVLLWFKEDFSPRIFSCTAGLFLVTILLTFSRSAWVTLVLVISTYFVIKCVRKGLVVQVRQKKKIVISASFGLLLLFLLPNPVKERCLSLFTTDQLTWQRRQELVRVALKLIGERPLLGVGMNQFPFWVEKFSQLIGPSLWVQPVHNLWLLIAAEDGLIGLSLFSFFCFWLLRRLKKICVGLEAECGFLWVILLGIFLTSLVDHYWWTTQHGIMFLGTVLGICFSHLNDSSS